MSASPAVLKPTELKLPLEVSGGPCEEDLVDNLITDLDKDITPTDRDSSDGSTKKLLSVQHKSGTAAQSAAAVSSINAEWKRLSHPSDAASCAVTPAATDALENDSLQARQSKKKKPKLSDVDLYLQPSQVEEFLTQNSVLGQSSSTTNKKAKKPSASTAAASASPVLTVGIQPLASPRRAPLPSSAQRRGSWLDSFKMCLSPVVGMWKTEKKPPAKREVYEIPFADIRELDFIGSGSQGAVFAGDYLGEKVAVKKVRDINYCQEAIHMRKLSHPNVVKFR